MGNSRTSYLSNKILSSFLHGAIRAQQLRKEADFAIAPRAAELAPSHTYVDSVWLRTTFLIFDSFDARHHVLNAVTGEPDCITPDERVDLATKRQAVCHFDQALREDVWNQC